MKKVVNILDFWDKFKRDKKAVVGLVVLILIIIIGIFVPYMPLPDPWEGKFELFGVPNLAHPMGTDSLGRDVFSRIMWGTRISLVFALGVATLSLLIGTFLGAIPGYYGGIIDDIISRFTDVFLILPTFLLMILVVALFANNIFLEMVVVGLTIWPTNAKIARAQVLAIKNQPFVESCISDGASDFRIIFRHILPNGIYPLITNMTLQMGQAVMWEAGFSFLGLGDPNVVSWGQVLYSAQKYVASTWWTALYPGIAIFLIVFSFNLIGDGINFALNPKLREGG